MLALALDHSFRSQKLSDIASRLNIYVQSVLAQIEVKDRYSLCKPLAFIGDAGFSQRKDASLYGIITNSDDTVIWQSTSITKTQDDEVLPFLGASKLGKLTHKVLINDKDREFISVSYRVQIDIVSCEVEQIPVPVVQPGKSNDRTRGQVMHHSDGTLDSGKNLRTLSQADSPKLLPQALGIHLHGRPRPVTTQHLNTANGQNKIVEIVIKISEALDTRHEKFIRQSGADDRSQSSSQINPAESLPEIVTQPLIEGKPATVLESAWGEVVTRTTIQSPAPVVNTEDDIEVHTYYDDLRQFRITLSMGFFAVIAVYLLLFTIFLRVWGLMPMRKVSEELDNIKAGAAEKLTGLYPEEISGLTESINRLIISERAQQQRYRNSLGDLAHSLKTPLTVLVGAAQQQGLPRAFKQDMEDQVLRMRQIIDYQLQRAAAGRTTLAAPVHVGKSVQRIANTLFKAYAEKSVHYNQEVESGVVFLGDEGDFLEMLGNLMENAFKWCNGEVTVNAFHHSGNDDFTIEIEILDNGPGVPEDKIESVLTRGFKADEGVSGQGIGLSVVKEIIHAYNGKLEIARSTLGGAKFKVFI